MKKLINKIWISASPTAVFLVLAISVVPLSAFEAHVVNVTAKIERRPCVFFETRSYGFWKTHPEVRIYPQTLGGVGISTNEDADAVFSLPDNLMVNKLKKQLLALKFNVSFYNSSTALVPGGTTTISGLIAEADAMLVADPPASKNDLEAMKNKVESANTNGTLSTCPDESGENGHEDEDKDKEDKNNKNKNLELQSAGTAETNATTTATTTTATTTDMTNTATTTGPTATTTESVVATTTPESAATTTPESTEPENSDNTNTTAATTTDAATTTEAVLEPEPEEEPIEEPEKEPEENGENPTEENSAPEETPPV